MQYQKLNNDCKKKLTKKKNKKIKKLTKKNPLRKINKEIQK